MLKIMYEVPSRNDIAEVRITPECVRGKGKCKYILKK
jgi:ATP-dependent protease Clp ATPase subunit